MSDEWLEWEWDETLFVGAAEYYDRGRLPNAPGLAKAFQAALGLDGRRRLLDVGCGPGTVTLPLSDLFQEVIGLDADAGMIREARRLASERGPEVVVVPDRRTMVRSSDDLVAETFSLSSAAPHLFGDRLSEFEADLRLVLAEASPDGRFSVRLPDNELKIWRGAKP